MAKDQGIMSAPALHEIVSGDFHFPSSRHSRAELPSFLQYRHVGGVRSGGFITGEPSAPATETVL